MGELVLVGLGLHDDMGISLRGLEEVKTANTVFIELYTNLLPSFSMKRLENVSGKNVCAVSREEIEVRNGKSILEVAGRGKAVLLVPGDPLIATTHVALRIEAEKHGIKTRVVHGASILSAVIGLSGLHNYKFGKSVTIPFADQTSSVTPHAVVTENKNLGLHTLCLLDVKTEEERYLNVNNGLKTLLEADIKKKAGTITMDTLAVGIARAGSEDPTVKAGFIRNLLDYDFGKPPHSLVFPGRLHFMEAEALIVLAYAPEELRMVAE